MWSNGVLRSQNFFTYIEAVSSQMLEETEVPGEKTINWWIRDQVVRDAVQSLEREPRHQFPCCYLPQHRYDPVIMINQQVVQMQIEIDENHINESAIKILEILRPSWHKREIKFKRFHEGRMNTLVGCYLDGKFDEDVVLIRKYGNNTNLLVNRKEETDIIKILSQEGICMPLYATLSNGIAYGFIHGEKLNVETVRDEHISRLIAKEMAKLHSIKTKGDNPKPKLFDKLDKWMEYIPHSFEDPALPSRLILSQEKDKLRRELESLDCPVVLCHNDLGITNIIYNKEKDEVKFIDFEFAGYNFSAFDIGEHFSEYAGVSGVDHGSYPDKDYQLKWIRNYLTYLKQYYNEEKAVTDKDVEKLYVQANKFAPVGNFVWGLWALIQIKHGDTGFNYLGAAKTQFAEYFKKRQNE